ncbi:hypothetical protein GGF50DRAFT_62622 [Schizophyllum commune]
MGKHTLSPAPLPPRKRAQTVAHQTPQTAPTLTFETALYDELILLCFSFLSYRDLCLSQSTSKNWARLSADNHLWKGLYLHTFGRARLRGTRGFIGRTDGREVRPLPGRAARGGVGREKYVDYRDWKWMFRISANWKSGRCVAERLHLSPSPLAGTSRELSATSNSRAAAHILLAGALTIMASASSPPTIRLQSPTSQHTIECLPIQASATSGPRAPAPSPTSITALAMDQSPPVAGHIRIATFLSNGGIQVYSIDPAHLPAARCCITYTPLRRAERTQQAAYHHPLLTTLSESFDLNVYDLLDATVRRVESLSSFTSYPPSSMVLSAAAVSPARDSADAPEDSSHTSSPAAYKLVLSFAVPVFPSHWSLGSTEIILAGPTPSTSSLPSAASMLHTEASAPPFTIISTRTARALDVPQGFVDQTKLRAMRAQWGRKVVAVADTATDGRWVVLAGGEPLPTGFETSATHSLLSFSPPSSPSSCSSSLPAYVTSPPVQLYRLSLPSSASASAKLTFVRHLYGAEGALSALSLADGRCVALGANGRVWVWDLEGGSEGVEVGAGELGEDATGMKGTVAFDERTIVTANAAGVVVRRLDV